MPSRSIRRWDIGSPGSFRDIAKTRSKPSWIRRRSCTKHSDIERWRAANVTDLSRTTNHLRHYDPGRDDPAQPGTTATYGCFSAVLSGSAGKRSRMSGRAGNVGLCVRSRRAAPLVVTGQALLRALIGVAGSDSTEPIPCRALRRELVRADVG